MTVLLICPESHNEWYQYCRSNFYVFNIMLLSAVEYSIPTTPIALSSTTILEKKTKKPWNNQALNDRNDPASSYDAAIRVENKNPGYGYSRSQRPGGHPSGKLTLQRFSNPTLTIMMDCINSLHYG